MYKRFLPALRLQICETDCFPLTLIHICFFASTSTSGCRRCERNSKELTVAVPKVGRKRRLNGFLSCYRVMRQPYSTYSGNLPKRSTKQKQTLQFTLYASWFTGNFSTVLRISFSNPFSGNVILFPVSGIIYSSTKVTEWLIRLHSCIKSLTPQPEKKNLK